MQRAVGLDGIVKVLGAVPCDGSLCRGSALWRHLVTWLGDVADLIAEQQGTSFDDILGRTVLSWLHATTDCCHGEA